MKFGKIVKSAVSNVSYSLHKHSPEIFLGVGIVGIVGGTVLACKATLKAPKIVEEAKEDLTQVEIAKECQINGEEYTEQDAARDKTIIFGRTAAEFAKAYGPAIILTAFGIGCIIKGHNILKGRNIALMAAYKAVDAGFRNYQNRVEQKFGKKVAEELRHGIEEKELTVEKKTKDGKKTKEKVKKKAVNPGDVSPYARFWQEGCVNFTGDPDYDLVYLKNVQNTANNMLTAKKWLSLNEVYKMLGIPECSEGQIVGWKLNGEGDGYVDFGIFNGSVAKNRDFVNGYESCILLDFNVDGVIYDDITYIEREKF